MIARFLALFLLCLPFSLNAAENDFLDVRALENSPYYEMGNPDAPIVLYEFFSFTCPACALFNKKTFPLLKEHYIKTGKLRIVFYDIATDSLALIAGKIARCLGPGTYDRFTHFLFQDQEEWAYGAEPLEALEKRALLFGKGKEGFEACVADKAINKRMLIAQKALQKTIDFTHIPYAILALKNQSSKDGKKIEGFQDFKFYKAHIKSLLD